MGANGRANTKDGNCKIYCLINKITGKIYIGQTWMESYKDRMGGKGGGYASSPKLYEAIQKFGVENFEYETLAICCTQAEADIIEDEYIVKFNSIDPEIGYNSQRGGSAGQHSDETKQKISESLKGRIFFEETKEKLRGNQNALGYKHTDEWKENNSDMMKERHATEGHPMQGKQHTSEAKEKISTANKGRKLDPESVKKRAKSRELPEATQKEVIRLYLTGMTIKDIIKITGIRHVHRILKRHNVPLLKNFKKWKGRTHSEETKQKMSQSAEELWEKRKEQLELEENVKTEEISENIKIESTTNSEQKALKALKDKNFK